MSLYKYNCPGCNLEIWTSSYYATCPCCYRFFYATESIHARTPSNGTTFVNGIPLEQWLNQGEDNASKVRIKSEND
jgi:hypothetical protein